VTAGDPDPDSGLDARLRRDLTPIARMGATLSYIQAARAMGLGPPGAIRRLTEALERLMAEDAAAARPFLAAVVVSPRRGGLPAPGFFETAAALGRPAPPGGEAAFHAAERRALAAQGGR
jgi:hypothetical protein